MIQPKQEDITIYQGATFLNEYVWKSGKPPAPLDITNYTIRMQIRVHVSSKNVLVNLDNDTLGGITISDALNGRFAVRIEADKTDDIQIPQSVYDIEAEAPDGTVTRLVEGRVTVSKQVTRSVN